MKKSLLVIALAAATTPFTFAAQAPASNPPAAGQTGTTAKTKKHTKKAKKAPKTDASKSSASK